MWGWGGFLHQTILHHQLGVTQFCHYLQTASDPTGTGSVGKSASTPDTDPKSRLSLARLPAGMHWRFPQPLLCVDEIASTAHRPRGNVHKLDLWFVRKGHNPGTASRQRHRARYMGRGAELPWGSGSHPPQISGCTPTLLGSQGASLWRCARSNPGPRASTQTLAQLPSLEVEGGLEAGPPGKQFPP